MDKKYISMLAGDTPLGWAENGFVNIAKWTDKEFGTYSIWYSRVPIYVILDGESLYNFMRSQRVEVNEVFFHENFISYEVENK